MPGEEHRSCPSSLSYSNDLLSSTSEKKGFSSNCSVILKPLLMSLKSSTFNCKHEGHKHELRTPGLVASTEGV